MALYDEEAFIPLEELPNTDALASIIMRDAEIHAEPLHVVAESDFPEAHEEIATGEAFYQAIGKVPVSKHADKPDIVITSDNTLALKHGEITLQGDTLFIFNALLAYRNKPQRAEEMRALGFRDRTTIMRTRQHFANTITSLIRSVNTASDAQVIEKEGVTKGTRYQISPEATIIDQRNAMLLIGENPSYVERDKILTSLCKQYSEDSYVQQQLFCYRNESSNPVRSHTSDELGNYMKEVNAYRLLTKDDEIELFGKIEAGFKKYAALSSLDGISDEDRHVLLDMVAAREIVYNTNLRLVVKVSRRYWGVRGTMSEVDLVQEGNCGLALAIPRMKIEKGYKFSTYATPWIRQAAGRAIANQSREIRIPAHMHEKYAKAVRDVRELSMELGRDPTEQEIEVATKMPMEKYMELIRHGRGRLVSLNKLLDEDSDTELGDLIARTEFDYTHTDESFQNIGVIKNIVSRSSLTDRQLFVIAMRFGITDILPKTLKLERKKGKPISAQKLIAHIDPNTPQTIYKVGELLNVTGERIRQIEIEAMKNLRQAAATIEV